MKCVVLILSVENPTGKPSEIQSQINGFIAKESAKLGEIHSVSLTPHCTLGNNSGGSTVITYAVTFNYTERVLGPD